MADDLDNDDDDDIKAEKNAIISDLPAALREAELEGVSLTASDLAVLDEKGNRPGKKAELDALADKIHKLAVKEAEREAQALMEAASLVGLSENAAAEAKEAVVPLLGPGGIMDVASIITGDPNHGIGHKGQNTRLAPPLPDRSPPRN